MHQLRVQTFPFHDGSRSVCGDCLSQFAYLELVVMGPPMCPNCPWGRKCSELVSQSMRDKWARSEGSKWAWGRDGCAWFILCQKCHLSEHPFDFRTNNGASRPGDDGRRLLSDRALAVSGCVFWFLTASGCM